MLSESEKSIGRSVSIVSESGGGMRGDNKGKARL
jgi:hypothetical protein